MPCAVLQEHEKLQRARYYSGFLEANTLLVMLAIVKPKTIATTLMRISLAIKRVVGDKSTECLMFNGEKAMTCLTATSERSIWPEVQV